MLGSNFSFEAFAKNLKEKAFKCSLETTEVLLDADGVAPYCFKSHTNS